MNNIGLYKQLTPFTTKNAGMSEWCKAEKDGRIYFIKKFHSPVYPSGALGLSEQKYKTRVKKFHQATRQRTDMYKALRANDTSGVLIVPVEVINYQHHICTVADFFTSNVSIEQVHLLSEWQRIVLMRTLTLALMSVHRAGVVHSDMKPSNILLWQNAENGSCILKLIDFDSSFMESEPPQDIAGDPAFAAPEVYAMTAVQGVKPDHRIDIFALGIVLHCLWTGRLPEMKPGQTIGQRVYAGEAIVLDSAVPAPLQSVIQHAMKGNPDQRISCADIYDALGDMLAKYPAKIVNLQEKPKKEKPPIAQVDKVPDKPRPDRTEPVGAEPDTRKDKAEIIILSCDEKGRVIRTQKAYAAYGKQYTLHASGIPGYRLVSDSDTVQINVSITSNVADRTVRFVYAREKPKKKAGRLLLILLALATAYCIIVHSLLVTAYNEERWEAAKGYIDIFPFASVVYKDMYTRTADELAKQNYDIAVQNYRAGYYEVAYDLFWEFPEDYSDATLYRILCAAAIDPKHGEYYDKVVENIEFDGAKKVLAYNSVLFNKFIKGLWIKSRDGNHEWVRFEGPDRFKQLVADDPMIEEVLFADGGVYITFYNNSGIHKLFDITIINEDEFLLEDGDDNTYYYNRK